MNVHIILSQKIVEHVYLFLVE